MPLFRDVLLVCDEEGLLGGSFFALDGLKLPSNASKQWSGKLSELQRKKEKLESKVKGLLKEHEQEDEGDDEPPGPGSFRGSKRKYLWVPIAVQLINLSRKMAGKIDTTTGRKIYPRRIAIVEPVFANIRTHKRLDHFTLRSKIKVDIQWMLYCMVHNIGKIVNYGST